MELKISSRFLFQLLLSADANMRLVCQKVSSEKADPMLSLCWVYYCEPMKYKEHLDLIDDQKDMVSVIH